MPIELTCQCGFRLVAKDALAGKVATCPRCGGQVKAPQVQYHVRLTPDEVLDRLRANTTMTLRQALRRFTPAETWERLRLNTEKKVGQVLKAVFRPTSVLFLEIDGQEFRLHRGGKAPRGSICGSVEATPRGARIDAQFVANAGLIAFAVLFNLVWIGFSIFAASNVPLAPPMRLLCLGGMIALGAFLAVLLTRSVRSEEKRLLSFLRDLFKEDMV